MTNQGDQKLMIIDAKYSKYYHNMDVQVRN